MLGLVLVKRHVIVLVSDAIAAEYRLLHCRE